MLRIPRLTPRFLRRRAALGANAGPAALALARVIQALLREELPGLQDAEGLMPPVARYWFRRVPGQNLWLWYSFDNRHLSLVSLTNAPPVPIDPNE